MKSIKKIMSYANTEYLVIGVPVLVYLGYKLALEIWCIAYGLIY
jgi:hypothetical protein